MQSNYINTRAAIGSIIGLSVAASLFLVWLIYFKPTPEQFSGSLTFLPALNAVLNGLSATSICFGFFYIRKRNWETHKRFMLLALVFSSLFLVSYVLHHYLHGDTRFLGTGPVRPVYFFVLVSHIVLSVIALPLVLITFFFSLSERFNTHARIARYTFPIWLYVSVTGVLVFLFQLAYPASN